MTAASNSRLRTFIAAAQSEPEDLAPLLNASVVVARQHMAAKNLRTDHAAVLVAQTASARRPHEPSPDAERTELRALRKFFTTASASLGMATGPKGEDE